MAFPQTPLDVLIELFISGAWTDITSDVYGRGDITIERGRPDEGQRTDPGKCTMTLNNRLGKYSPRNPRSPYYQLIGRNTPIRVSVNAGTPFLELPGNTADRATTPDHASLDITGDIDVRLDVTLDTWRAGTTNTELAGKYLLTGDQRSWLFMVDQLGRLVFRWSADGAATIQKFSTVPVTPPSSGRLTVRATLDVDDGSGNNVVTFYQGPGITGPWTQLDQVVTAGTTSIFNSTASVDVGDVAFLGFLPAVGRAHKFQVRDGIDGTLVADPDFTVQTVGDTSFDDGAGRTWTVSGSAAITNRRTRFIGEVSAWPPLWDVSGNDVEVPIEAAGILRRLGQGQSPLDSTLRRRIPSYSPLAYWPLEDGASATEGASPIDGVNPLRLARVNWAQADSLPSSKALPVLASSSGSLPTLRGTIPRPTSTLTAWSVYWIYRLDTANTTLRTFMRVLATSGTVAEWYIQTRNDLSRVIGLDSDGGTVFSQDIGTSDDLYGQWVQVRFDASQNGGNVDWTITWTDVGGDAGQFSSSFAGTVGRPTAVTSPPSGYSSDLDGMAIGHVSAWPSATTAAYNGAIDAWTGETAGERMIRLADEENLPLVVYGDTSVQEPVGPQHVDTLLNLLETAAAADGGILYERRNTVGLAYRDRNTLYNQTPALELDYTTDGHVSPPLEPVDDDQELRNDRTVVRDGGSSARAVLQSGALSVQAPPDGVGIYDDSVTLNLYQDSQTEPQAFWLLHLGTWDEARYPVIHVDLAAAPSLIDDVTALDSGDRATIANPPEWLPPGPIDQLAQGYTEVIGHPIDWDVYLNCTPAGPWTVGVIDNGIIGTKIDSGLSTTAAYIDADDTLLPVKVASGLPWVTDSGEFPFDIRVGGEEMTVSAIDDGAPVRDAFGRTESSGWGTADSGQAWTTTGGSAPDYSVSSGEGRHSVGTVNVSRFTTAAAGDADFDALVSVATDALATGNNQQAYLVARYLDTSNFYAARLDFTTSQEVTITIIKIVGGSPGAFTTETTALTHAAGTKYRLRFQGIGAQLKAKVWLESDSEPTTWDTEVADNDLTLAGSVGVRTRFLTGNTNTLPVVVAFTDFQSPQLFAVTRSANGITKPHTADTAVRVVDAAPAAL